VTGAVAVWGYPGFWPEWSRARYRHATGVQLNRQVREISVDKAPRRRINLEAANARPPTVACLTQKRARLPSWYRAHPGEETMRHRNGWLSRQLGCVALFMVAAILAALPTSGMADSNQDFAIVALSSPPYAVSGGTVLVRVELPRNVSSNDLIITLNSQAVTNAFRPEAGQNSLLGLASLSG